VWPETFSYVTEEAMDMGLPIACFDLGAPAERVRGYAKGVVIERIDARAALDAMLGWARRCEAATTVP
jgi:glycosyltransferase involved in cell wall biosynthesis